MVLTQTLHCCLHFHLQVRDVGQLPSGLAVVMEDELEVLRAIYGDDLTQVKGGSGQEGAEGAGATKLLVRLGDNSTGRCQCTVHVTLPHGYPGSRAAVMEIRTGGGVLPRCEGCERWLENANNRRAHLLLPVLGMFPG